MSSVRLMEHIWRTIEDVKYAELNGDTGNRAGLPWYESSHDHFMQDLFNWCDELTQEVDLTPIFASPDAATDTHVQFWMMLPADDMTWEEIDEEPSILSRENGCKPIYIDVYPRFGYYEVIVRTNPHEIGDQDPDEELQEIADRVFTALHMWYESDEQF